MKVGIDRSAPELARAAPLAKLCSGEVIGERYRIEALLGQGGMGVVYAAMHQTGDVLRARDTNPSLPSTLAAVIDRALQNAPEQRHPDMVHFAHALGAAALSAGLSVPEDPDPIGLPNFSALHLEGQPWASGPLARIFAAASKAKRSAAPSSGAETNPPARTRSRPGWRVSLALLFVALLAGATLALKRPSSPSRPTASVPTRAPARAAEPALRAAPERPEPLGAPHRAQSPAADIPSPDSAGTIVLQEPPRAEWGEVGKRAARRAGTRARTKRAHDAVVPGASEFEKEWK